MTSSDKPDSKKRDEPMDESGTPADSPDPLPSTEAKPHKAKPKSRKKEKTEEAPVVCQCMNHRHLKAGAKVWKWGFRFTVHEDGLVLTSPIPAYAVRDGIKSGRWRPVGMDSSESDEIYVRAEFKAKFFKDAPLAMNVAAIQALLNEPSGKETIRAR